TSPVTQDDGYLSPYCCSSDEELDRSQNRELLDEMPAFSTHSLSPSGRSLSPIDMETPSPPRYSLNSTYHSAFGTPCDSPSQQPPPGKGYVTLEEINARIGMTPPDSERSRSRLNLETIFEGQFLETPPKKEFESRTNQSNLLRRSLRNRALFGGVDPVSQSSPSSSKGGDIENLSGQFDSACRIIRN
ncbi:uncharacterized protein LOC129748616, partial [Uranotaenia lowii]|uniref:uncharacterized protein LOC129748616 n=1 Tax=Uranotaenia lowii TaxID=190385 RepID=UPI0024784F59